MALNEGLNNLLATTGGVIGGAAGMGASKVIERLGKLGSRPNNFADEGVKNQAIEILRRESGAAIPEGELQATMDMLRSNTESGAAMPPMSGAAMPPMSGASTGMNTLRRESGSVINEAELMNALRSETGAVVNEAELMELQQAIQLLQEQMSMTNDPEEKEILGRMIDNTIIKANAPQANIIDQLSQGAGEDDMMAHVRSGDVNVSREMIENNPALENAIEGAALEVGIDPESMVYGTGIASLNVNTGAEQHGFFKKIIKGVGKVVKKVAPIAMLIPGVGTALGGVLGGIGGLATKIPGIGGALGSIGSSVAGGIANLGIPGISSIAGGTAGGFSGIGSALTSKAGLLGGGMFGETGSMYAGGPQAGKGLANRLGMGSGTAGQVEAYQKAQQAQTLLGNLTPAQRAVMDPKQIQYLEGLAAGGNSTGFMSNVSSIFGGGGQQQVYDAQGNPVQQGGGIASLFGGSGLGGMAGMAGAGLLAGKLGKLAYDEAKDQKGVSLSPVVAMDATGRYNLEAEMARRMGQQAPNPTEFGLLPANTFPELSGGKPREVMAAAYGGSVQNFKDGGPGIAALRKVAPEVVERMGYNMGGYVMPMAYAEGGNVAMEDFNRMNGQINGEGTETSDDIPAMLSDGEFVMTGQAVRGAGSYKMTNDSGIVTLTPSGKPSRDAGTETMYQLMEAFSSRTGPA